MRFAPARFAPATPVRVNLASDTQTRPTPGMRAAMAAAEVGDEQAGSDPTVWALCDRVAARLGKEAAMFLPSGTMANQVALATHCRPGDQVLAHEDAHILTSEAGAQSAITGVLVHGLPGPRGQFDVAALESAITSPSRYSPPQRLVEVEQTANRGGGACWPADLLCAVAACARAHGLTTHMDGARLLNAEVALGAPAAVQAAGYDSVWLDFTKGLGAPMGAVLCGSADFIDRAWLWKQRLGGAMRQGGIAAAACLYALDHHVARLAEDHANARALAAGMAEVPGLLVEPPETNLVFFDTARTGMSAAAFAARLAAVGVLVSVVEGTRARACLHLDVSTAQVEEALAAMRTAAG
ncbi:MAG: threonine aldolase family protein [Rhodospirillales bacterium]|jgi:threonine aldolase|nr:threonine aldolase family protein [Rhodospirillales bacterium]